MNLWNTAWGAWLLEFATMATVVLLALAAARVLVRQPQGRVALAWGAWIGLLLLAAAIALPDRPRLNLAPLTASLPRNPQPVLLERPSKRSLEVTMNATAAHGIDAAPLVQPPAETVLGRTARHLWEWFPLTWLVGAMLASGWVLLGWVGARRLVHDSHEAPAWARQDMFDLLGGSPRPRLRTSRHLAAAVALGALRPHILLPAASAVEGNRRAIRAALAHEWAHIRRGDLWLLSIERLLLPLLVWNPLFWWLRRGVRHDQELLADAEAAGDAPLDYAEALLSWARASGPASAGGATLAIWEPSSPLNRRIQMLLQTRTQSRPGSTRLAWVISLGPVVLAVALALVSWRPTTAQTQPAATTEPVPAAKALPAAGGPQVLLEVRVFSLDRKAVFGSGTTLRELVIQITDGVEIHGEGKFITAEIPATKVEKMSERLRKLKGVSLLSEPRILTLSGREASIRVGSDEPVLRSSESINGVRAASIVTRLSGTELVLVPTVLEDTIAIRVAAELSRVGRADDKNGLPSVDSRKLRFSAAIAAGNALLFADVADAEDEREQSLVLIQAKTVTATTVESGSVPLSTVTAPSEKRHADASDRIRQLESLVAQLRLEIGATKSANCLKCHVAGRQPAEAELPCPAMPPKPATAEQPATTAAPRRLISRDLKLLDIRAAESEFLATREEYDEARKMHESATISAAELRIKRLAVERAQIALERAKLELEQFDEGLKGQSSSR